MVFERDMREGGLLFGLTLSDRTKADNAKFMQKPAIIEKVGRMDFSKNLLRLENIICIDGEFQKQEIVYVFPNDKDKFASDMMDISMAYAIIWLNTDILGSNEIAVAKTAHNSTNIDADVIGAFLDKIEEDNNG